MEILFVCFGNRCRSPMMAALFRKLAPSMDARIESAGIHEKAKEGFLASDHSVTVMQETGIDITDHRSRWIGDVDLESFDYILCVGSAEADAVRELLPKDSSVKVEVLGGPDGIPNPYEKPVEVYRKCREHIRSALNGWMFVKFIG